MIPVLRIHAVRRPWALLLCLALAACADVPGPTAASESLFSDSSFAPPSEPIAAADVFRVSPAMRSYLQTQVAEAVDKRGEARGLLEALFLDRRLHVDYDSEFTRDAAQTFDARAGNCLSLAIVTGAMAKELGLEVRYQSVQTSEHWEWEGDLLERVGHVNVSVGLPVPKVQNWGVRNDRWTVDFVPSSELRGLTTEPISESRIVAMFMNNRAAEALAKKHLDDAYWWVRAGVAVDSSFDELYNTLGVTYLRKGLLREAESALRFAAARAPASSETRSNLAVVLRRDGRPEQAAEVERRHPTTSGAALVLAIEDGMKANAAGDYDHALALFQRALRTSGDNHQLHYLLAVTYLNLGDRRHAMEHLLAAEDNSTTARQRSIYSSKAALLKSTTSSFRLDPDVVQTQ